MRQNTPVQIDRDQILSEWKSAVGQLADEVGSWCAEKSNWRVSRSDKEITEELLGTYEVPHLILQTPKGRLHIEPVARVVLGGHGTVEFYAWPTLYRVRLIRSPNGQEWKILTDSGIKWPAPWNRDTFFTLADELLDANEG